MTDGGSETEADPTTTLPRAALAEDARTLVATLEAIHPDPYASYGGRIALHRRLEETVRDLPEAATVDDFYRRTAPLAARIEDSHTELCAPDWTDSASERRLPVSLRVVGTNLYVDAVHDEVLTDLLGVRVVGVDGDRIDALAERQAERKGTENRYGTLAFLSRSIESYGGLRYLLGRSKPPAEPTVEFRRTDGTVEVRTLTPVDADASAIESLPTTVPRPSGTGPRYRLLDGGRVAVFVPGDLQGYREHVEIVSNWGSEDAAEIAREAHDRTVGGSVPGDRDAVVAALPSMTETLTALVREMADAGTETLLVDLRNNPGGNSVYADVLTYVLFGWNGLGRVERRYDVPRRTDAHRRRYGVGGPDEAVIDTAADNPSDFDFGHYFIATESDHGDRVAAARERLTANSETFAEEAADGTHAGYYRPDRVIAITSAHTFSSGLAAPLQLSQLGGDVVGVPSGQAPTLFGEPVRETLPNTGLELRVAGKYLNWHPEGDANVLVPDCELTPKRFARYDRAGDASLRLALDYADGRV